MQRPQDTLCFETLSGIDAPLDRRLFWAVTLVLGYLGYAYDAAMPQVAIIDLLSGERHAPEPSHRMRFVPDLLHQQMGFSANTAREWASIYQRECGRRFEPDQETPSSTPTREQLRQGNSNGQTRTQALTLKCCRP